MLMIKNQFFGKTTPLPHLQQWDVTTLLGFTMPIEVNWDRLVKIEVNITVFIK